MKNLTPTSTVVSDDAFYRKLYSDDTLAKTNLVTTEPEVPGISLSRPDDIPTEVFGAAVELMHLMPPEHRKHWNTVQFAARMVNGGIEVRAVHVEVAHSSTAVVLERMK